MVVSGMDTDSALLTDPVFTNRHADGRDMNRPFIRGERDPAALALAVVGAIRVSPDEIEMCTWDADAQKLKVTQPFRERPDLFHVYRLPPRRVADGATKHTWYFGTRLGPKATGQCSNMVVGSEQPSVPPALRKVN